MGLKRLGLFEFLHIAVTTSCVVAVLFVCCCRFFAMSKNNAMTVFISSSMATVMLVLKVSLPLANPDTRFS